MCNILCIINLITDLEKKSKVVKLFILYYSFWPMLNVLIMFTNLLYPS